jgi:hypothetical protein
MSFGPYRYFNNGLSFTACESDYVAQSGEAVFADTPTAADLAAAFPDYASIKAAEAEEAATLEARRAASQKLLESYIAGLNSSYSLSLTASMDYAEAVADIAASSMTQAVAEVKIPYLKTLYDTLTKLGGLK